MNFLRAILFLSLTLTLAGCSGLTTYKARTALVWWSCTEKYVPPGSGSYSCEPSSDDVSNNTGVVEVKGIQDLPQENGAKVDIYLTDFRYASGGSERKYSGNGTPISQEERNL